MEILDIHTHHEAPQPQGVVALCLRDGEATPSMMPTQRYSVGIHPWDTTLEPSEKLWTRVETAASLPETVAIGESGVDLTPRGGPMFRQIQIFRRHTDLSEKLCKPLVIHDVKGHDVIIGCRRDLHPAQNWVIHGFRRKAEVARMLLRAGCWLSFGAEFNPDALRATPADRILAETDESPLTIDEVITRLSAAYGSDLRETIAANTRKFLGN
ncbi:MAG: TatD family hydrolase [Muribaculaceae bacterium]|nr:TatD family hydrolase [Muribaculaceae bacterium]